MSSALGGRRVSPLERLQRLPLPLLAVILFAVGVLAGMAFAFLVGMIV